MNFDDAYSENREMFGHPYKELQDFFNTQKEKGKLLDVGSGQGRDSLFLAKIGYEVTALDSSAIGIGQTKGKAEQNNLSIDCIVSDILSFETGGKFDVILFDMILHTIDKIERLKLLSKYSTFLTENGIFCIVLPDDMEPGDFLLDSFEIHKDFVVNDVPKMDNEKADYTFRMIILQKK